MADMAVSEKLLPPVFGKERKATRWFQANIPNTVLAFFYFHRLTLIISPVHAKE